LTARPTEPVTHSAPRITVVNDNPDFLDLVQEALEGAGYAVSVHQGRGLDVDGLVATRPDLLIVDLRLEPGHHTGWEFLVLARAHPALADVPVIVCSADVAELDERADELRELANTHVLPKPFALAELEGVVGTALNSARPASRTA
jgi:DNA-binding response OmpR family regulator